LAVAFGDEGKKPRFTLPPNYKPENDPYSDEWGKFKHSRRRHAILEMMRGYYAMTANLDWHFGRLGKGTDEASPLYRDHWIKDRAITHVHRRGAGWPRK
jgi:arylsulfatase A-like enzyme